MPVELQIDDGEPQWWLSPNIWTVSGNPNGPATVPMPGQECYMWARVANRGQAEVQGATVKFYWADPSTVITRESVTLIGKSYVDLVQEDSKDVLCLTPWKPSWANQGHVCLIVECYHQTLDPITNYAPDAIFNPAQDRKIAQRNIIIAPAATSDDHLMIPFTVMNLHSFRSKEVVIKAVEIPLNDANVLTQLPKRDAIGEVRFGLRPNQAGDRGGIGVKSTTVQLEPNQRADYTLNVSMPSTTDYSGVHIAVVQMLPSGSVVGGLSAVFALNGRPKSLGGKPARIADVPVSIPCRPFAIFPKTNFMNPDGFFVVNMGVQYIQAYIQSDQDLNDVQVYIEACSHPGIDLVASVVSFPSVKRGTQHAVRFTGDFVRGAPGAHLVSFIVGTSGGHYRRVIKKIFVTEISYDKNAKQYVVATPQGAARVVFHKVIFGGGDSISQDRQLDSPVVILPTDVTMTVIPNPGYQGTRGPLPYDDPWWKLVLLLLSGLLALAGALTDYFSDNEFDGGIVSVKHTFQETDEGPCDQLEISAFGSPTNSEIGDWVVKALYAASGFVLTATVANLVAGAPAKDGPDVFYRGQEIATPATPTEYTESESVELHVELHEPPSPGTRFVADASWKYTRNTTAGVYTTPVIVDQRQPNIHYLDSYKVQAPDAWNRKDPLIVSATFAKEDNRFFGNQLYVIGVLMTTDGTVRTFELRDDASIPDQNIDGWYTGQYKFRDNDLPGPWYLFVFAQNVNTVVDGTNPEEAAQTIGGFVLTNQLRMTFPPDPCKLIHDKVIQVT